MIDFEWMCALCTTDQFSKRVEPSGPVTIAFGNFNLLGSGPAIGPGVHAWRRGIVESHNVGIIQ